MEVVTIITSDKDTFCVFEKFIYSFPSLHLIKKDIDTAFFQSIKGDKDRIYYHFELVDTKYELGYNFSDEAIVSITSFYGKKEFYIFYLSYWPESLLTETLTAFKRYLLNFNKELLLNILINHPFDGVKIFAAEY